MDFPDFLSLTMLRMISATIAASMSKTITVPIYLPPFPVVAYFAPASDFVLTFNELLSLYGRNSM
jgi:hypothetical protein